MRVRERLERLARGDSRSGLTTPDVSATVGEALEALRRAPGKGAIRRTRRRRDARVARLAAGPLGFDARLALGFRAEARLDEIIYVRQEDDHVPAVA